MDDTAVGRRGEIAQREQRRESKWEERPQRGTEGEAEKAFEEIMAENFPKFERT